MEKRKSASDTLLIFTAIFSINKIYFKNSKHYCITDKPSYCKVFSKTANEEIIHTHTLSQGVAQA